MTKILLIHKEEKDDKCQKLIIELIENFNAEVVERENFEKSMLKGKDLIITLGGDGTFVTAAQITNLPILSINSNLNKSEGALTKFKIEEKDKIIGLIKNKNWKIETFPAIEIELNKQKLQIYAVNEVYVGSYKHYHTSRYKIRYKNKEEEQKSSGILISTSTGSTAWYKSAGGTPFKEQELKFIIREPYTGNIHKPTILNGTIQDEFEIKIKNRIGVIVLDSEKEIPVKENDNIKVRLIKDRIKRIIS
ncbi:MAG: NAD(+)/NADH kinase [archaeon]|nr:NAD(+)/NADH kinase [archaeon]